MMRDVAFERVEELLIRAEDLWVYSSLDVGGLPSLRVLELEPTHEAFAGGDIGRLRRGLSSRGEVEQIVVKTGGTRM
jgi:hypothetical protein